MDEDDYTRITLRIPKDLHIELTEAAKDSSKSMNAEILDRLRKSFTVDEGRVSTLTVLSKALAREQKRAEFFENMSRTLAIYLDEGVKYFPRTKKTEPVIAMVNKCVETALAFTSKAPLEKKKTLIQELNDATKAFTDSIKDDKP